MAEFQWDGANVAHLQPHSVLPEEAEEAYLDPRRRGIAVYDVAGERRWGLIGATDRGRILFVVYTLRKGKIRIITARDADRRDRKRYKR